MVLHTLNAAPGSSAWQDCLRHLQREDVLLLLGDGVYGAIAQTEACQSLEATGTELYALQGDVDAAGIGQRLGSVTICDMAGFVKLSERCAKQMAWY